MSMSQPDILFIVLDTQRADRLGCYGHSTAITPNLDRFAAESALFEQAIAPAQWTIPSHASMFTGLYPTAHQLTQSHESLGPDLPHLVELLRAGGYQTVGFCNNPLVGVLNNGLKRGFQTFYNYGGAIPSLPRRNSRLPAPFSHIVEAYTQFLRRISYPIQNFFGQSDLAFQISLNAWLTPLWSRLANFKGQNERSVGDICHFLSERERTAAKRPLFMFVNLMETHLPFWPPGDIVDKVAPYMRRNKEARTLMRNWNREAYRWAAPLAEPLGELESRVLSDMYDAEVAYQDDYLGRLFDLLRQRRNRDNTLTLIVGDHGDSLGEHGYFGHAFVAYQELVHVPLMVHWPAALRPERIGNPVSTRRVFHTVLDAAGEISVERPGLQPADVAALSLRKTIAGRDPENNTAYAEVYPPLNFVRAIEQRRPELISRFRCRSLRRAIVKDDLKLIQVDEMPEELYNLDRDPEERDNLSPVEPAVTTHLNQLLKRAVSQLDLQRDKLVAGAELDLESDEQLMKRLRGLGYVE